MADDSQRAKARATFGSSFFENSKAIPAPKNFASAQQKTANSRPIPTFKVGGAVKKADSGMPRNRPMPYDKMGAKLPRKADGGLPPVRQAAVMQRAMNDQGGSPMTGMGAPALKVMKKGGKIQTSADTARKLTKEMGGMNHGGRARMKPQQKNLGGVLKKIVGMSPIGALLSGKAGKMGALGLVGSALGIGRKKKKPMMPPPQLAAAPGQIAGIGAALTPGMLPPPKDPMVMAPPTPAPMGMRPEDMVNPSETVTMQAKRGGKAMKMAVGGAGKTRKGMAPMKRAQGGTATNSTLHPATSNKTGDRRDPEYGDYILADKDAMKKLQGSSSAPVKKAQGGAAKVRRGMMTQSGQITPGVKPHKGIRAC